MLASTLEKIRQRKAQEKKKPRKRQVKWLFPTGIEREYSRDLLSLTYYLRDLINTYLLPEIPSMVTEVEGKMPTARGDDFLDRLNAIIIFIRGSVQNKTESTISKSDAIAIEIAKFNQVQFQKVNESVFGINLYLDEPWLEDQMKLFAKQNAQLIRSLPNQEIDRVAQIVERGLQEGKTYSDIAKELKKSYAISDRRAKLIARDQTAKLNASLTMLRQKEIGVSEYRWQTSGDERVRKSHSVLDGKLCRWDDPTVFLDEKSGKWVKRSTIGGDPEHPRQAVNCRCEPIADLNGLLDI